FHAKPVQQEGIASPQGALFSHAELSLTSHQGQLRKHISPAPQFRHISPTQQSALVVHTPPFPTQPEAAAADVGAAIEITRGIVMAAAVPSLRTNSRRDICFPC